MRLRDYQISAVEAVYEHLENRTDNPCVVIPTGGGKSPIIARICSDAINKWNGRVLVLAHVRELLRQNVEHLEKIDPSLFGKIGVYSAGLNARDVQQAIIVGGIQSVYDKAAELGAFDLILIDEAHRIPPEGEGMYRTLLNEAKIVNPNVRLIGFTATPYRTSSGWICSPENLLNEICFEIGIRELIVAKYLCPLVSKGGSQKVDTSQLHIRAGEFVADEASALMDQESIVNTACLDIEARTKDRKRILVFATSVEHANHLASVLNSFHLPAEVVVGETLTSDRNRIVENFRKGDLRCLINCNVFTEGFDVPSVDCVALVRPTASPGLYAQMCGRGLRIAPEKITCLILDFGGNILRHGPLDAMQINNKKHKGQNQAAPAKECPECNSIIHAAFSHCPDCGYEFPDRGYTHDKTASGASPLAESKEFDVENVYYNEHIKKSAPDLPHTLRVMYKLGSGIYISEWVCPEHTGYARRKFEQFWIVRKGQYPVPSTALEAYNRGSELEVPKKILVIQEGKYDHVVKTFDFVKVENPAF